MIGSLSSGLLDNLKVLGLSRVLSLTPFVGFIGNMIFMSSRLSVRTFENLVRRSNAQFHEHNLINGKPVSEYVGGSLDEYTFEIVLHSSLGVEPLTEVEKLKGMLDSGVAHCVFLNGKNQGRWTIRSIEHEETHWHGGRPAVIFVTLVLLEHVESMPVEARQKLREMELKRNDTGLGGPERLAGTGTEEKLQERVLTRVVTDEYNFGYQ